MKLKNVINKHKSNKIKENSNTVRHLNNRTDHRHSKSCCDQSSPARRTMKVVYCWHVFIMPLQSMTANMMQQGLIKPVKFLQNTWGGWGCEVSCGGHHRPRGKTTTGSALDGAVFDIAQILAYLVHNMSRSQLYLGFGHFVWPPSFFGQ